MKASSYEEHGDLCIALGTPRFLADAESARATQDGNAAAWYSAFLDRGPKAAQMVLGRFAAILIRPSRRHLIAVTDRFATVSICYSETREEIRFGTRADEVAGSTSELSAQSIFDYLFFHVIPAPATAFNDVFRLPAAHTIEWKDGESSCEPYWIPKFSENERASLKEQEDRFMHLIEAAVEREADGQDVGAFLSGGTDSSTVVGMLCRLMGAPAETYSIGFDATGYDEMEYARIAAKHFGAKHHEYYVTPDDVLDGIPKVAFHFDQPFGNSSAVPSWICSRRAKDDGIEKLLAGDGGDELFAGNERYAKQRVFERYDLIPEVVRNTLLEPILRISGVGRLPLVAKAASYVQQARVPLPDRLQSYNLLLRIGLDRLFEPSFLEKISADSPLEHQRSHWRSIESSSFVDKMTAFDWKYTLSDNDLPKVLGAAEIAKIDIGFPLLSDELLEFSLELPSNWKLKGRTLRWFFKYALRDFLPEAILRKPKHGFGLPFGVWTCSHEGLRSLAHDALTNLSNRGVVRPAFLDQLLREHLPAHPGYYGEMVWILVMLELWLQSHYPNWRCT